MSVTHKKIGLVLVLLLLLGGCGKKLPPQVKEGKAFSEQPYVVQGNVRYSVKEYQFGLLKGDQPAKENYVSIKLLAENIGSVAESVSPKSIVLKHKLRTYELMETIPENFKQKILKPGETSTAWLIFDRNRKPDSQLYLNIKDAQIKIQ